MADGKRESSAVAVASPSSVAMARGTRGGNPLEELSARIKAIEAGFRTWMAKQPTHIEAAVSTAVGAVQGGALGGSWVRSRPTVGRRSRCRSRHPTQTRRPWRHSSKLRLSSSSNSVFSCVFFLIPLVEIVPFDPEIRITDVLIHLRGMFV
jgi:hypothetical protein